MSKFGNDYNNINEQDSDGNTALHRVLFVDNLEDAANLINIGAQDIANNDNITPSMLLLQKRANSVFKLMLQKGINVNATDNDGNTLLFYALRYNLFDTANDLIEKGASVNIQNNNGITPLMIAACASDIAPIKAILNKEVNIDFQDLYYKNTALDLAISRYNEEIAKILLDAGASCSLSDIEGCTALMLCASKGCKLTMEYIIKKNPNCINMRDIHGRTALYYALYNYQSETAQILLNKGAFSNIKDNTDITPLMVASANGVSEIVESMLRDVCYINDQDNQGITALHYAFYNNKLGIVHMLLKFGASYEISSIEGDTALMIASRRGDVQALEMMISSGIRNINKQHQNGYAALHYALDCGRLDIAQTLLDNGACFYPIENEQFPAFIIAASKGYNNIVTWMLEHGVDIDMSTQNGETALYSAIYYQHFATAQILLDAGASITHQTNDKVTPLILAVRMRYTDVVKSMICKCQDNLDTQDHNGYSALYYAMCLNYTDIARMLIEAGANIKPSCLTQYLYIITLRNYYDCATRKPDEVLDNSSAEYKLAIINKLHYLLRNNPPDAQSSIKELVLYSEYLQNIISRNIIDNDIIIKYFDGNMSNFFIKCQKLCNTATYYEYITSIVDGNVLPSIKQNALKTAINYNFLWRNKEILSFYVESIAGCQTKQDFVSVIGNANLNMLTMCYKYCMINDENYQNTKQITLALNALYDTFGQKSIYLVDQVLLKDSTLWQEHSQKYDLLKCCYSKYAYELSLGAAKILKVAHNNHEKYAEICHFGLGKLFVQSSESGNKELLCQIANYFEIPTYEAEEFILKTWQDKVVLLSNLPDVFKEFL